MVLLRALHLGLELGEVGILDHLTLLHLPLGDERLSHILQGIVQDLGDGRGDGLGVLGRDPLRLQSPHQGEGVDEESPLAVGLDELRDVEDLPSPVAVEERRGGRGGGGGGGVGDEAGDGAGGEGGGGGGEGRSGLRRSEQSPSPLAHDASSRHLIENQIKSNEREGNC